MHKVEVGQRFRIESYKHNGKRHRTWEGSILLHNSGNIVICGNNQIRVTESSGNAWYTREPAICTFYANRWFNVITMIRSDGYYHYCNMGSPIRWGESALFYIDYDLDIKIYPDYSYDLLDEDEFQANQKAMYYPTEVVSKVREASHQVISLLQQRKEPFDADYVDKWYERFLELNGK